MLIQPLLDGSRRFYQAYPELCYVLAGAVLLLALWKPGKVLKTALLLLVLSLILYVCFYLLGSLNTGLMSKDKAVHRSENAIAPEDR